MKKLLFTLFAGSLLSMASLSAQEAIPKGTILVEANTGNATLGNTGMYLSSTKGDTNYNVGLDGGYFVMENLAIKGGLGYSNGDSRTSTISYRLGAKYYVNGMIPLTLDLTGASIKDADENPLWLGLGGGYAIFLSEKVAIEPGVRYNVTLNETANPENLFQFNVGFTLFL